MLRGEPTLDFVDHAGVHAGGRERSMSCRASFGVRTRSWKTVGLHVIGQRKSAWDRAWNSPKASAALLPLPEFRGGSPDCDLLCSHHQNVSVVASGRWRPSGGTSVAASLHFDMSTAGFAWSWSSDRC